MPKTNTSVTIKWVSKAEMRKVLDARARRVAGVSGATYYKRMQSGAVGPVDRQAGGAELAALCSFVGGSPARTNRKRSK